MYSFDTLHRGKDNKFYIEDLDTELVVELEPLFSPELWDNKEVYELAGVRGYEPMTAKELETEEQQNRVLDDSNYYIEEKFDGTRALVHFFSQEVVDENALSDSELKEIGYCRVFSRRVSKKTGFYVENTDSVPHIRETCVPELAGTVLDGEMFINDLPFKEVSSTLNCLWDKAIDRQLEKGFISFHAFDIIKYKGIDLRKMPLERRKVYLYLAIQEANNPYIEEVSYYSCGNSIGVNTNDEITKRLGEDNQDAIDQYYNYLEENHAHYLELYNCIVAEKPLTPRAYYELIVSTGGEGCIVKPKKGLYKHKRGWEYSKIKKFLTRDLILIDFEEPTREYKGKAPKDWGYYEGDTPVTKHYYNKQVGNLVLGVLLTEEELQSIPKNKRGKLYTPVCAGIMNNDELYIMVVCVCGGFDDDTRAYFTRNRKRLIGSVVEVKANELFKDTGKMRHPRYFRMRDDKESLRCTWKDHISA